MLSPTYFRLSQFSAVEFSFCATHIQPTSPILSCCLCLDEMLLFEFSFLRRRKNKRCEDSVLPEGRVADDKNSDNHPVDLHLDWVLGKMPRKVGII